MTTYQPRLTVTSDKSIYLVMVRVDRDGYAHVVRDFRSRFFKTMEGALKAAEKYIAGKQNKTETGGV